MKDTTTLLRETFNRIIGVGERICGDESLWKKCEVCGEEFMRKSYFFRDPVTGETCESKKCVYCRGTMDVKFFHPGMLEYVVYRQYDNPEGLTCQQRGKYGMLCEKATEVYYVVNGERYCYGCFFLMKNRGLQLLAQRKKVESR